MGSMFSRIFRLGWIGFLQLLRSQLYVNLLIAGIVLVGAAFAFDELSAGVGGRVLTDVGLAFIALLTATLAGTVTITTLTREIETKQLHPLLARPIARFEVVIGRFLTTALLILCSNIILGCFLAGIYTLIGYRGGEKIILAAVFASWESLILTAIALFFGTASSSIMSAIFTVSFFVAGRLSEALHALLTTNKFGGQLKSILEYVYAVLPHFFSFDLTEWTRDNTTIDVSQLAQASLYGFCYTGVFLFAAAWRLEKRELY